MAATGGSGEADGSGAHCASFSFLRRLLSRKKEGWMEGRGKPKGRIKFCLAMAGARKIRLYSLGKTNRRSDIMTSLMHHITEPSPSVEAPCLGAGVGRAYSARRD